MSELELRVLVTGANGFVGKSLCAELINRGHIVRAALRPRRSLNMLECETFQISNVDAYTDWSGGFTGVDTVIHLAARVHVMQDNASNPLEEFRKVNVSGTEHLARSAAKAGVKRLVYVSSIKVNGESTRGKRQFSESDEAAPHDAYGISKCEAEQALHRVAQETDLEVVILRPPLVYGVGVQGNFAQMMKMLAKDIPLPLATVHNHRSLVYVENLVGALILCATHPAARGKTYLISDGDDISTPDLLHQLGEAMGHPARLFSCPPSFLKIACRLVGRADQGDRILGSLRVDSGKIRRELDWTPPYTLQEGLRITGQSFIDGQS